MSIHLAQILGSLRQHLGLGYCKHQRKSNSSYYFGMCWFLDLMRFHIEFCNIHQFNRELIIFLTLITSLFWPMILFQTTSYKSVISYLRMTLAWLQNFMIFIDYKQLVSIQLHQIEHVSLSFKAFLNPSH